MIEVIIAIMLFFRQSAQYISSNNDIAGLLGSNLDPIFLIGLVGLHYIVTHNHIREFIQWSTPILIIVCLQLFLIPDLNLLHWAVNTTKILLCISVMVTVRHYSSQINIYKISKIFSYILLPFLAIALLIDYNNILWKLNDGVNRFDLTRLKLLFLEPSELGFTLIIIIMTLLYYILVVRLSRKKLALNLCLLVANIYALYLAKPLGAIAIGGLSIIILLIHYLLISGPSSRLKKISAYLVAVSAILSIALLFSPETPLRSIDNSIVQRAIVVAQGKDGSVNYRTEFSKEIAIDNLKETPLTGAGFGQSGTDQFISKYYDQGLRTSIVNSFFGFITESGFIGVIFIISLIAILLRHALRSKNPLLIGLLVFVVIYQLSGSHFTNPLIWCIYGLILSGKTALSNKNNLHTQKEMYKSYSN